MRRLAPRYLTAFAGLLAALVLSPAAAAGGPRAVAVIVDTSGSMADNDPERNAVQISQILSDLVDDGDALTVVRMAPTDRCGAGPDPSLAIPLDPHRREAFKERLRSEIGFHTGTHFAAATRTAVQFLRRHRGRERMLLVVADSGGMGSCEAALTRDLMDLRQEGVMVAAVNLGSTAGAFDRNPAFDFTVAALDAPGLIRAVGDVYQRFLGAKQVQHGTVQGDIRVEVAPYVLRAFLVVAADGRLGKLVEGSGNPGADEVDLDHRGGGFVDSGGGRRQGILDVLLGPSGPARGSTRREYRIVRLEQPRAGTWTFRAPQLTGDAGWLLVQELIPLTVRWVEPSGAAVVGRPTRGVVQVVNAETGDPVTPSLLRDVRLTAEVDGRTHTLVDDGSGADEVAGDGLYSTEMVFGSRGSRASVSFETGTRTAVTTDLDVEVREASWEMEPRSPERVEAGTPATLLARLRAIGDRLSLPEVERIEADTGDQVVVLEDDGEEPDAAAGDDLFSGTWTPTRPGSREISYSAVTAEADAVPTTAVGPVEVVGRLRLGQPPPVELGTASSGEVGTGQLDLSGAEVEGTFEIGLTTDLALGSTALEVETAGGWVALGRRPVTLPLSDSGRRRWPVRLRVGGCPDGTTPGQENRLLLTATAGDGTAVEAAVPLVLEVREDPWLVCWWPVLALLAGLAVTGVTIHGFWSPARFPPRFGVVISQEEDLEEGFLHPVRENRASRSGFYRNASICVASDYRLTGNAAGAVARLQAEGSRVRVSPVGGGALWRRSADGRWEEVPPEGTPTYPGTVYRNDDKSLYFETRNA